MHVIQDGGAVVRSNRTSGLFSCDEKCYHINVLELLAVYYGLRALLDGESNCHIKVLSDNTTSVHCLNNMGSCKSSNCDSITKKIWYWAIRRNIWLSEEAKQN